MSAGNDSAQEKTHDATPKRLEDARRDGQVLQSRELTSFLVMTLPSAALLVFGPHIVSGLGRSMEAGLSVSPAVIHGDQSLEQHLYTVLSPLAGLLIVMLLGVVGGIASSCVLGGMLFNPSLAGFRFNRLDPISGLGRMFGPTALMELVKSLIKAVWLLAVLGIILWWDFAGILAISHLDRPAALAQTALLVAYGLLIMSLATALIAFIDVPWQIWDHGKKLRMSLQEVRDEMKETDGRPEVKARLRQIAQELSRRRMMEDVKTADVVVTNPSHYSVAIRYSPDRAGAPIVVAKGQDEVAHWIREVATAARVPLLEQPPLARALYFHTAIGEEIPAALYGAVAQVLAFIFRLRARGATPSSMGALDPVAVPAGMDRREGVE